MNCQRCGTELPGDANYCLKCGAEQPVEESGDGLFSVVLTRLGNQKIQVIKVVREATNLGLADAKNLVESAPVRVKDGLSRGDAAALKSELEAQGAAAEVMPTAAAATASRRPRRSWPAAASFCPRAAAPTDYPGGRAPPAGTSGGGCFIATACYGDFDHPDVLAFRRFRDDRLLPSPAGRLCVKGYYAVSPAIARRLGDAPRLAGMVRRRVLRPLARWLRTR